MPRVVVSPQNSRLVSLCSRFASRRSTSSSPGTGPGTRRVLQKLQTGVVARSSRSTAKSCSRTTRRDARRRRRRRPPPSEPRRRNARACRACICAESRPVRAELRERRRARARARTWPPSPRGRLHGVRAVHACISNGAKKPGSRGHLAARRGTVDVQPLSSPPNRRAATAASPRSRPRATPLPRRRGRTGGSRRRSPRLRRRGRRRPPTGSAAARRRVCLGGVAGGARARATGEPGTSRALVAAPWGTGAASDEESAAAPAWTTATAATRPPSPRRGDGPRKGRPALASSGNQHPTRRDAVVRRGASVGSGKTRVRDGTAAGESMKRAVGERERQPQEDVRRRRDRDFRRAGTHQLLRVLRGQPVQEELIQLELGRGTCSRSASRRSLGSWRR